MKKFSKFCPVAAKILLLILLIDFVEDSLGFSISTCNYNDQLQSNCSNFVRQLTSNADQIITETLKEIQSDIAMTRQSYEELLEQKEKSDDRDTQDLLMQEKLMVLDSPEVSFRRKEVRDYHQFGRGVKNHNSTTDGLRWRTISFKKRELPKRNEENLVAR